MMKQSNLFFQGGQRKLIAGTAFGLLLISSARAADPSHPMPKSPDEFLRGALNASQVELQAGQLAQEKAESELVRKLGATLVEDQKTIRSELEQLAEERGIQPEQDAQPKHQDESSKLREISGLEFDRVFLRQIVQDHQRDLAMLRKSADQFESDGKLIAIIREYTPTVEKHLNQALDAARDLGIPVKYGAPEGGRAQIEPRESASTAVHDTATPAVKDTEVLGLPASNNDGTILGILPAPSRTVRAGADQSYIAEELADGKIQPGIQNVWQADQDAVGAPPTWEREKAAGKTLTRTGEAAQKTANAVPEQVRRALRQQGWQESAGQIKEVTVFQATVNGEEVYVSQDGQVLEPSAR